MRSFLIALALSSMTLSVTSGCGIYFGDDDDDCLFGGGSSGDKEAPGAQQAPLELRNPQTGQCESFGWGDPPPCDGSCGPCPGTLEPAVPQPTWGFCDSFCTGLDEETCLATAGCRGGYIDWCLTDNCDYPPEYYECWSTDQTGPVQGACDGLDAWSCSQHDDCISIHASGCDSGTGPGGDGLIACTIGSFSSCATEDNAPTGCYGDNECGPGEHCNASEVCMSPPNGDCDPSSGFCDPVCYGFCVPDTTDPGNCYDDLLCDIRPPNCPSGTTPGIANGCWTGFCIPLDQCETTMACAEIQAEATCVARFDCDPLYVGIDCTCNANGCTCASWNYDSCETSAP